MPKRKNNDIYKYKVKRTGKIQYGFKAYLGKDPETGKIIKITRQGFKTYSEANATYIKIKSNGAGKIARQRKEKENAKKLSEIYAIWFPSYMSTVKESTAEKTRELWVNHVEPEFGNDFVNKISIDHVQKWVSSLPDQLVKFKSPINLLNRLIEFAIMRRDASTNPLKFVVMPTKTTRKRRDTSTNFYELDELKEFLATAKKTNYVAYVYFEILGNLGLRKSEALTIKWGDIDFDKRDIHIQRTSADGLHHKKIMQAPKTKKSDRVLPLPDNLYKILQDYKKYAIKDKDISDFLFHTIEGRTPYPSQAYKWQVQIENAHKPKLRHITIHGFRHTYATLLLENNPNIKPTDLQAMLGHEKVTTSLNIYTHVTANSKKNVTEQMNKLDL